MYENISNKNYLGRNACQSLQIAKKLKLAASHHIQSFNFLLSEGLEKICKHLSPIEIVQPRERGKLPFGKMSIWITELAMGTPTVPPVATSQKLPFDSRLYPTICRQMGRSYTAPLLITIQRQIDDAPTETLRVSLGEIPILVKSNKCYLANMTEKELIENGEDCNEFGGYFVVNGNEKIIRMLIMQKRNYAIAFKRPGYKTKGFNFSQLAVQMRCVREDSYARTITLHYLNDGNVYLRILLRKKELQMPVILIIKALLDVTDHQIYNAIVRGKAERSEISDRVEVMLSDARTRGIYTRLEALAYIGRLLRVELNIHNHNTTDVEVGQIFLAEHICVHLQDDGDKVKIITLMVEKLYALVVDEINPDNLDSLMTQEVLLTGHLYTMILREKLEELLLGLREKMLKDASRGQDLAKLRDLQYIKRAIDLQTPLGEKIENFLATGNLRSATGLDLMQQSGFTIIADKLNNMRFLSHFRSVHRGAFFSEMKTTTVRKLLPEQWGFVCPVHTPDGGPCGLLNHITMQCQPLTHPDKESEERICQLLSSLGVTPTHFGMTYPPSSLPVLLNGRLVGYVEQALVQCLEDAFRVYKSDGTVGETTEFALIPRTHLIRTPVFPGVFISTEEARLVRPVKNLKLDTTEWITPLEQHNMSIACSEQDIRTDTQYQEIDPAYILSILAASVPFLNFNQSPRNMYQCQMAKQTMGTPCHNFPYRFDNKMYRILFPQMPAVKCLGYEDYGLSEYPSGTNAIVAVISYTGYDMEDAMIVGKSSYERGLGHGIIYKTCRYSLAGNTNSQQDTKNPKYRLLSRLKPSQYSAIKELIPPSLQPSGTPPIGSLLKKNSPMLALFDSHTQSIKVHQYKESEPARVDQILLVSRTDQEHDVDVVFKLRINRNPVIGDKFSSRHGQKGVMSVLWPQQDMPFSEQGLVPDIIINPHAFPSRMTIGMLIESMAGKAGAMRGQILETSPFQPFENDNATDYFGKQLLKFGYNYNGNETLYSGIYGTPFHVDIYMGVVYYQRLRHMVSDKSQARSQGVVDVLTQQPIKGRKKGGGIRLGEMERDALIAHGVAYCLNDRLLKCSDYSEGYICDRCGGMLSSFLKQDTMSGENLESMLNHQSSQPISQAKPYCTSCKAEDCTKISLPFVLRYLVNELAAMNVKVKFNTQ